MSSGRKTREGQDNPNWHGGMVCIRCEQCGIFFDVIPSRRGKARFCTIYCANLWQTNNPYIGRRKKYIEKKCLYCGAKFEVQPSRVKKILFCSKQCSFAWRAEHTSGDKNPNWSGGKSREPYTYDWRKISAEIIKRDGRCMNPYCRGECSSLQVHHINYDKQDNSPENLLTLCAKCHAQSNFGREEWMYYYQGIVGSGSSARLG